MRLPLLLILASLAAAATQEEQNRLWEEAMRKSAAAPRSTSIAKEDRQEAAPSGDKEGEVTRADIEAAAMAYVKLVVSHHEQLLAKIPAVLPVEINKDMTIRQVDEARIINQKADTYRSLKRMILLAKSEKDPMRAHGYANSLDFSVYRDDTGSGAEYRALLGIAAKK